MSIVIGGMHRSGTSMITNLLRTCGLNLGPEKNLIMPKPDNPAGFWENIKFVQLNEAVLANINGAWDYPPLQENIDILDKHEFPIIDKVASELVADFEGLEHWGWKDPRNSLTLRFWRRFVPEMKLVYCVRNPIDVFLSLNKRNNFSSLLSLNLWFRYNLELARAVTGIPTIVTHFESYFEDPAAELKRVLEFLNLEPDEKQFNLAVSTVKTDLVHASHSENQLKESGVSDNIIEVYKVLCNQGGPIFQKVREKAAKPTEE